MKADKKVMYGSIAKAVKTVAYLGAGTRSLATAYEPKVPSQLKQK